MRKHTIQVLLVAVSLLGAASCNKKLDITPVQSIDQTTALTTSDLVKATLVGAYASLGGVLGGQSYVYADLLAYTSEISFTGTFQGLTQISDKQITVDNGFATSLWLSGYQTVNQTNNVLASLPIVTSVDRGRVEGESKFIRGTVFFELVKLYARTYRDGDPNANPGIPLVTTPTTIPDATSNLPRSTVAQTYAQIIKDLTDAERLLPASNDVYATKYAAAAMLSRVYLMQRDYVAAGAAANRVISSNQYQLKFFVEEAFPNLSQKPASNTSEDIYAQQVDIQSGSNALNTYYGSSSYGGRGDIQIEDAFLSQFEANDDRANLFIDDGSVRSLKFQNQYGNVPVLRLAEMYLTRAEANFRAGTTVGATPLSDVNLIRNRANLPSLTAATLNLNAILKERYLELAFEGQYLHDLKRTQRNVGSLPWNDSRLIFPIPQREIQANPALVQNTAYL